MPYRPTGPTVLSSSWLRKLYERRKRKARGSEHEDLFPLFPSFFPWKSTEDILFDLLAMRTNENMKVDVPYCFNNVLQTMFTGNLLTPEEG